MIERHVSINWLHGSFRGYFERYWLWIMRKDWWLVNRASWPRMGRSWRESVLLFRRTSWALFLYTSPTFFCCNSTSQSIFVLEGYIFCILMCLFPRASRKFISCRQTGEETNLNTGSMKLYGHSWRKRPQQWWTVLFEAEILETRKHCLGSMPSDNSQNNIFFYSRIH
jgi:hypothetical protein